MIYGLYFCLYFGAKCWFRVAFWCSFESNWYQKWAKGRPKCIKKPGPHFGSSRETVRRPLWRHFLDFGCHFGGHWILKGSQNRPFLYKTTAWKHVKTWWRNYAKRKCPEILKNQFSHYTCRNVRFSMSRNYGKWCSKRRPKRIQNGQLVRHLVDNLRFRWVLEKCVFCMNFGVGNILLKNWKLLQHVPQMMSATWILAGPAECAGQPGGWEG